MKGALMRKPEKEAFETRVESSLESRASDASVP